MIPLDVTLNIDDKPWTDCKDVALGTIIRIGRLPKGTVSGKSTVTVLIKMDDGKQFMAQTTLALLVASTAALKSSAQKEGECLDEISGRGKN